MTKLSVRVIAGSSREEVIQENETTLKIYLRQKPERGKANERLKELVAEKFQIPKSKVMIVKGATSNRKLIQIL